MHKGWPKLVHHTQLLLALYVAIYGMFLSTNITIFCSYHIVISTKAFQLLYFKL